MNDAWLVEDDTGAGLSGAERLWRVRVTKEHRLRNAVPLRRNTGEASPFWPVTFENDHVSKSAFRKTAHKGVIMAPILLIHGLFGPLDDPGIIAPFGTALVFAPDLIGYGENRNGARKSWTLEDQVDHVASWLRGRSAAPVHVVGHSVGGAVAFLFARRYPQMTLSVTSVEGNFTLKDAFWSQQISTKELEDIEAEIADFRSDVPGWLAKSGVPITPWTLTAGQRMLDNQPAATLRAQAVAVIAATGSPTYLQCVRQILASGMPLHLISGARSRDGWDVPGWVVQGAASDNAIPDTGHLMMLEKPEVFAQTILTNLKD